MNHFEIIQTLSRRRKLSVYVVGGFVRDWFLNRSGYDVDFTVSQDALGLARAFSRAIKGTFVLLDEEHPCGRVVKRKGRHLWTFDFSNLRAATIERDLRLRDFTINTLCINLGDIDENRWDKNIIKPQGGLKDLKNKTVRMVATRAFVDDPLRLMRAFSLLAQLGFKIEAKTFKQIQKDVKLIHNVSMERIREEWFKALSSSRTFETIVMMYKAGLLQEVIPQLTVMEGVYQGGYHHLDVWRHSLEVVRQFEELMEGTGEPFIKEYLQQEIAGGHQRYALLKFACLLHDIGKPDARQQGVGRMTFYGHEHVGAGITRLIAKQMKLSVKERHFLEDMVIWHLRPGYLSNFKKLSPRMVFRFLRDTKEEAVSVLLLSLADERATRGPLTTKAMHDHHRKICWDVIHRFIDAKNQKPLVRLITGHDLIRRLKLKPSPLFAKILTSVQEAQSLGKISTKVEAMAIAKKIAK